jgi:soluble lytic murein transglycosylase
MPAIRRGLILYAVSLVVASAPAAGADDIATLIRNDQWAEAAAAAERLPDPVAIKLVTYYRMLAPGAASASEISDFIGQNPDWPAQPVLEARRDAAIAAEPDDDTAAALCRNVTPKAASALARCAGPLAAAGATDSAAAVARAAWIAGITDATSEGEFLDRWGSVITADDQWARFGRLVAGSSGGGAAGSGHNGNNHGATGHAGNVHNGNGAHHKGGAHNGNGETNGANHGGSAFERQIERLSPDRKQLAAARLALRRDAPDAESRVAALSDADRDDPSLLLDRARYLRRAGQDEAALALWTAHGAAAQRAAPAEQAAAFWSERNQLARRRLRDGDPAGAYILAAEQGPGDVESSLDAEFLAGFIALRKLNDPAKASEHFRKLVTLSRAAITQGRAHYWLGRAAAAAHSDPVPDYRRAATWPTTYYGQLAAMALGGDSEQLDARIAKLRDPEWDREQVLAFAGREVTRAAMLLVSWGEMRRARVFLQRIDEISPGVADRSIAARLALGLGMTDQAVTLARHAGRDGVMLPVSGWPIPFEPRGDAAEPAMTLGVIRQESNFDPEALSGAGARGLMQLMPATAATMARQLALHKPVSTLVEDQETNVVLGANYLRAMLDAFGGSAPLAFAAYNAGPGHVEEWLGANGDPRSANGLDAMIDWIELIPFNETRNYVQRVIENVVIYRALLRERHGGASQQHPLAS